MQTEKERLWTQAMEIIVELGLAYLDKEDQRQHGQQTRTTGTIEQERAT